MKLIILVFQTVGTTDMHVDYGLVSSVHSMHLVGIQRKKKTKAVCQSPPGWKK
jgi:hypothetical protein